MAPPSGTVVDLMKTCAATITGTRVNVPCFGHIPDSLWENAEAFYEQLSGYVTKADSQKVIRMAHPILFKKHTTAWLHLAVGDPQILPADPRERVCELALGVALFCIPGRHSPRCQRVQPVTPRQLDDRMAQQAFDVHFERSQHHVEQNLSTVSTKLCLTFYRKIDELSDSITKQRARTMVDAIDDQDQTIGQVFLICQLLEMSLEEAFMGL